MKERGITTGENLDNLSPEELNDRLSYLYDAIPDFTVDDNANPFEIRLDTLTSEEKEEIIEQRGLAKHYGWAILDEEIIFEHHLSKAFFACEVRSAILENLNMLMSKAESTPSHQAYLKNRFNDFCYVVPKPNSQTDTDILKEYSLSGVSVCGNTSGIFQKETAIELERFSFNNLSSRLLREIQLFGDDPTMSKLLPALKREGQQMAKWRFEFIQYYNDEP